jgi:hypothetical protein
MHRTLPYIASSSTGHYVYLVRLGKLRFRKMEFDAGTCWADLSWNKASWNCAWAGETFAVDLGEDEAGPESYLLFCGVSWEDLWNHLTAWTGIKACTRLLNLQQNALTESEMKFLNWVSSRPLKPDQSAVLFWGAQLCYAFSVELLFCFCSIAFCGSQRTVLLVSNVTRLQNHDLYFPQLLIYSWTTGNKFHKNKDRILE